MMRWLPVLVLLLADIPVQAYENKQTVSLTTNNMPLKKVFEEIGKQTGYSFAYFETDLAKAKLVSIKVTNATLTEALTIIFGNQPLAYTIIGKIIVVKSKPDSLSITEPIN